MRSILTTAPLARRSRRLWSLGPRLDHRQRDAATILVDRRHPRANLVADRDDVVRIADVAGAELADVNEAAVGKADVDKRAEIDDVEHRAAQLHAGLQGLRT